MSERIRVVVVDDEALIRSGLRMLIEREPDLELVGEAADGAGAIELIRRLRPDVALIDIRMPGVDGLAALRAINQDPKPPDTAPAPPGRDAAQRKTAPARPGADPAEREAASAPSGADPAQPVADNARPGMGSAAPRTKVVVVTTFETDENVFAALQAGAAGFVLKDAEPAELIRAIRVVAGGEALLSPSVTRRVIARFGGGSGAPVAVDQLTEREREVAAWVATGRSNDEIAAELAVSPATIRTHVGRAMLKLNARDRAQLAVFAIRAGLTTK
ncbi:response regulator [Dactylosporangium salmoneum]|uniref:DNA-binding response regulator n=1 Tax=Dactylosporangium salmoneum TaxID=53361 RepID=A0ABP5TC41_9ACTN